MNIKKIFVGLLSVVALISLCACTSSPSGNEKQNGEKKSADEKKKVVVMTSFLNDMAHQIAGDTIDIEMIIPAGEDPHLYIAKPEDHDKILNADLVLYHGLHFEGKMVEVLEQVGKPVSKNFPSEKLNNMEEDGETIVDPHFWFDIELYKLAVDEMNMSLATLNPENKDMYQQNTDNYKKSLDELDEYIKTRISELPAESRYLITPHDAFNYFAKSYGVEVKAPQGVSTDTEVSNLDIQSTVDFIFEHKIKAVFVESTTDPSRMEKLKEALLAKGFELKIVSGEGKELYSDSLAPQGEKGDNFIDMYKHNVDLIVENLKE